MYQIVTDSCCDLPYQVLQAAKVDYLSMKIQLDEEELVDDLGKTFNYDHYMEQLRNGATPTTSQINVGQYLEFSVLMLNKIFLSFMLLFPVL